MRKSTWLALGVFVVLIAGAVFTLTRKPERGITRITFSALDTNSIDKIEIKGASPIVLTRQDGVWHVPNGREADKGSVEQLLANVRRIHSDDVYTQDANRYSELEVDAEKGRDVNLFAGNTKVGQFIVGKFTPGPAGSTSMRTGDTVYKVRDVFAFVFSHSPMEWTERHVVAADANDIARFNVRLAGQKPFTLAHNDKGFDLMADDSLPAGYRFDINAGTQLVNAVLGLQAQELLDQDPGVEVTKLDDNADKLTYFYNDAARSRTNVVSRTLVLGASRDDKQVYAKLEGRDGIFTLQETTASSLRRNLDSLRDLAVMSVDSGKVVSFVVEQGKNKYGLQRQDPSSPWTVSVGKAPAGFTADMPKVMKRIAMASHVRAIGVPDAMVKESAMGLEKPAAVVTLTTDDGTKTILKFGNKAGNDGYYAIGSIDEYPFIVGTYLHDQILGDLESLKKVGAAGGSDPFAQLDPSALQNLPPEVRASLQQQIAQKQREQQAMQHAGK